MFIISSLTPSCQLVPVSPKGSKIDFLEGLFFRITGMIFRYYPEIYFYTHFWNQISEKNSEARLMYIFLTHDYYDFKNGCKNKNQGNNEKSWSWFKTKAPQKIDFGADGSHESHPTAWELNHLCNVLLEIYKINPTQELKTWRISSIH